MINPPDPFAGGRSTDGTIWIENIANDIGATLMDYAVRILVLISPLVRTSNGTQQSGALTDLSLWPSNPTPADFLDQSEEVLSEQLLTGRNWLASSQDMLGVLSLAKVGYFSRT